jgi:hypothetical protein
MARTIGTLCTFIVGLQILIGVPLVVCIACFCATNGPITVEVHTGHGQPQFVVHGATIPPPAGQFALTPPPNAIPVAAPASLDNPILRSRAEHGSPLDGTMLESANPVEEQNTFITALEKAAAEQHSQPRQAVCPAGDTCSFAAEANSERSRPRAAERIVHHLYEMAEIDEQAANYDRADQWRAFAREIKESQERQKADAAAAASFSLPISGNSLGTGD